MAGLSPSRRREHRRAVDAGPRSRGRVTCVYASQNDLCQSTEPLLGNAAAPSACFQESLLESLFPVCTTTRRGEKANQVP